MGSGLIHPHKRKFLKFSTVYLIGISMVCFKRIICLRRYRRYLVVILSSLLLTVILQLNTTILMELNSSNLLADQWHSMNLSQIIRLEENTTIITPAITPELCQFKKSYVSKHPRLIIMVTSAPANRGARKAIRETWGDKSTLPSDVSVLFILGKSQDKNITKSVYEEAMTHEDIIVEDFTDCYENLTLKTLFSIKWMNTNCKGATHLLKTDDDMLILVDNLLEVLNDINLKVDQEKQAAKMDSNNGNFKPPLDEMAFFKYSTSTKQSLLELSSGKIKELNASGTYILGYLYQDPKPIRNKNSKWYLPYELYSKDYFPDFISGTAYVIALGKGTHGTMLSILRNSLEARPALPLEDVFITGIIANKAMGMPLLKGNEQLHKTTPLIHPWSINELATCFYYNSIAIHGLGAEAITKGWKIIRGLNEENCYSIKGRFYTFIYKIIWSLR